MKRLEKNTEKYICDAELGKDFLGKTPKAQCKRKKKKINWPSLKLRTSAL